MITGAVLLTCSLVEMGVEPGRVDSPPTSMMVAPSAIICIAWFSAVSMVLNLPPSEKESGVTFRIPMMTGELRFMVVVICLRCGLALVRVLRDRGCLGCASRSVRRSFRCCYVG